jgi:hypothetical protein
MGKIERAWAGSLSRRNATRALAGFVAGSPLLRSQQDPFPDHSRIPSPSTRWSQFSISTP